jgi:hypothetical protein
MAPLTIVVPEPKALPAHLPPILAKAKKNTSPLGLERLLLSFFGLQTNAAPFYAFHEGLDAQKGFWVCLSLASMSLVRDALYVEEKHLSAEEKGLLTAALSAFFAESGFRFYHGERCFLQSEKSYDFDAAPFECIQGSYLFDAPFQGPDAPFFARLLTEVQMLLAAHPVNLRREEKGQTPVNSVWLWGGGSWQNLQKKFEKIYTRHPLLCGLANASDIEISSFWQPDDLKAHRLIVEESVERVFALLPSLVRHTPLILIVAGKDQSTFFELFPRQRFFFWRR